MLAAISFTSLCSRVPLPLQNHRPLSFFRVSSRIGKTTAIVGIGISGVQPDGLLVVCNRLVVFAFVAVVRAPVVGGVQRNAQGSRRSTYLWD